MWLSSPSDLTAFGAVIWPKLGASSLVACVSERYKTAIHSAKIFGRYEWSSPRVDTKVALVVAAAAAVAFVVLATAVAAAAAADAAAPLLIRYRLDKIKDFFNNSYLFTGIYDLFR